ncbi:complex I subunit 4 family protein [Thiothrix nivea]|uniref:NADH-quinone oxidoreductase subunit M n=1 Tax=Thiothrix nivea (strain ATCC 35100 / DSM 5205 / JP2) TaxID=870187 RepID=A0A656HEQ4_THINJ|nr:NADH-quinone oxidoreductase subunit M [Thiothrix nivea]EIJ34682.1 NADH dehydrogenase subunit M [Thiothrix nivea DSM 5205]
MQALVNLNFPWLSLILLMLPMGAVLTALFPGKEARWAALTTAILTLGVSLVAVAGFDSAQTGFQLVETTPWMPDLGIAYRLGIDGLSVLFLPFTALLFIGVILASWNAIRTLPRLYFALLLVLECTIMGIFTALDTILFFLFWELTLLPLFFLISLWGSGANRRYAGVKYSLFMLAGGLPLLIGFVVLAIHHPGGMSFAYVDLLQESRDYGVQVTVFFLLLVGFGVKIPLFPLHTWLPVVAQEGPATTVALLTGLKVGAYGLLRFALPLVPQAAHEFQWVLVGLGMIGVLYGAVAALSQTSLRRMLAFASLSHVGMVVLGMASFSQQGLQGAVFQLLNFTLVAGGLFLITGFLHQRTGSTEILSLGGVAKSMPLLASLFFFLGLAGIGMPATSGFPAEFLLIMSVLETHTGAGLVVLFVVVLGAAYFLNFYRKAFLGEARHAIIRDAPDLKRRELGVLLLMVILVLVFGFYPQGILDITETSSQYWVSLMLPVDVSP